MSYDLGVLTLKVVCQMSCDAMPGDAAELQAGGSRGSRPPSRGSPEAPPLELPAPPDIQSSILRQMRLYAERRGRGQSVPPHPLGRYAEAPAAGLCPSAARREFPKSRLAAGAMLIAPILFIVCSVQGSQAAPWAAVSWGVGRLGPLKKMENAVSSRLFRSVCMLSAAAFASPHDIHG